MVARHLEARMSEPLVTFEQDGAIGAITLRRPEKFNALVLESFRARAVGA